MDGSRWITTAGLAAALVLALAPAARGADETDAELRERVQVLEQELGLLKRRLEVKDEEAAAKAATTVQVGAGVDGFFLRTPDQKFQLKLRGYTQFDSRWFTEDENAGVDSFYFRRVRPIVEGTLFENIDFKIMPDFAGSTVVLYDAYANLHYWNLAQLQLGKYKPPVGLERLQSATSLMFIERAFPTQLVPNRDLGVMLQGNTESQLFSYQVGAFNGVRDGGNAENSDVDTDDGKDVAARVFFHPFVDSRIAPLEGLGLGFATTWGQEKQAPPSYKTTGGQTFFAYRGASGTTPAVREEGARLRLAPQAYWYWGPAGLLGEYVRSNEHMKRGSSNVTADQVAWQASATYLLTGEAASYKGVVPLEPFQPSKGGWGAWELAARFHSIRLDDDVFPFFANPDTAASSAEAFAFGVNWYMSRWTKFVVNYEHTWFDGGAPGGKNRDTEGVVLTRFQLSY